MNETPLQQYIVRRPSVAEALALAEVLDTQKLTALARQLSETTVTETSFRIPAKSSFL